jgi:hypothetical protein
MDIAFLALLAVLAAGTFALVVALDRLGRREGRK